MDDVTGIHNPASVPIVVDRRVGGLTIFAS